MPTKPKIVLATDHAGFELKEAVKAYLLELQYQVTDFGANAYDEADDYPDFIAKAGAAVSADPVNTKGIIFGASGQGEAMVANRYQYVRCAVYYGNVLDIVTLAREHNDANILSFGARFVTVDEATTATKMFLETPFFSIDRHKRRIEKIDYLTGK